MIPLAQSLMLAPDLYVALFDRVSKWLSEHRDFDLGVYLGFSMDSREPLWPDLARVRVFLDAEISSWTSMGCSFVVFDAASTRDARAAFRRVAAHVEDRHNCKVIGEAIPEPGEPMRRTHAWLASDWFMRTVDPGFVSRVAPGEELIVMAHNVTPTQTFDMRRWADAGFVLGSYAAPEITRKAVEIMDEPRRAPAPFSAAALADLLGRWGETAGSAELASMLGGGKG